MADQPPPRSSSLSSPSSSSHLELRPRPIPQRSNSHNMRLSPSPSPVHQSHGHAHRPSFTEQLRHPPSPRQQRHQSLSQSQVQDLLNNPPTAGQADPRFAGKDWQHITVGELVSPDDVHFVELTTGIEEATTVSCMESLEFHIGRADLLMFSSISFNLRCPFFSSVLPSQRNPQLGHSTTGT